MVTMLWVQTVVHTDEDNLLGTYAPNEHQTGTARILSVPVEASWLSRRSTSQSRRTEANWEQLAWLPRIIAAGRLGLSDGVRESGGTVTRNSHRSGKRKWDIHSTTKCVRKTPQAQVFDGRTNHFLHIQIF